MRWLFLLALPAAPQSITVASLNLAMETNADRIVSELRTRPNIVNADIIFFQEVVTKDGAAAAEHVAKALGRQYVMASPDGRDSRSALMILSKYPLENPATHKLKPQNLVFRSRKRVALAVTVNTPLGKVRAINAHLDTRINPGERIAQLQSALDDASCFNGPSVIGGDFNTNDMQWLSNVVPLPWPGWQGEKVRELMRKRGYSTPFGAKIATFDHLGMQLDWIYSAGFDARASGIEPIGFSDHHAVWARLSLSRSSSPETVRSRAAQRGGA